MNEQAVVSTIFRKQQLHATITRACPNCGAGNNDQGSHFESWCCHVCGEWRPADEAQSGKPADINNNVVWTRVWRAPTIWERITNWLKGA
jgi:hypothetical protein